MNGDPLDELDEQAEEIASLQQEVSRLWRMVTEMKAAAETAGFVFRNTDSGPALVRS